MKSISLYSISSYSMISLMIRIYSIDQVFLLYITSNQFNVMMNISKSKESIQILEEYKDLIKIFSEKKINILSPHHNRFDHLIILEEDYKLIYELIYNLSE